VFGLGGGLAAGCAVSGWVEKMFLALAGVLQGYYSLPIAAVAKSMGDADLALWV
jgi:hypothetical protein